MAAGNSVSRLLPSTSLVRLGSVGRMGIVVIYWKKREHNMTRYIILSLIPRLPP